MPASARCSVRAARKIVSPSGMRPPACGSRVAAARGHRGDPPHLQAHRGRVEAGVDQERRERCSRRGTPLISPISSPAAPSSARASAASAAASARPTTTGRLVLRQPDQDWRPPRRVARQRAVDEHDERADGPRRAAPPALRVAGAGHFSIVPYGLAGSVAARTSVSRSSGGSRSDRSRSSAAAARTASRRRRRRNIRGGRARILERLQHVVDGAEAAGEALGAATSRVTTP